MRNGCIKSRLPRILKVLQLVCVPGKNIKSDPSGRTAVLKQEDPRPIFESSAFCLQYAFGSSSLVPVTHFAKHEIDALGQRFFPDQVDFRSFESNIASNDLDGRLAYEMGERKLFVSFAFVGRGFGSRAHS